MLVTIDSLIARLERFRCEAVSAGTTPVVLEGKVINSIELNATFNAVVIKTNGIKTQRSTEKLVA
jgi:hypothetical protein